MASSPRLIRPRFWLFVSALLLNQLIVPALAERRWETFEPKLGNDKRSQEPTVRLDARSLIQDTGRLSIPSEFQELVDFAKSNISASIINSEDSGLFTGTCQVEPQTCQTSDLRPTTYSWASLGKGLLELLKIAGVVSSAFCLSLSVASIATCGGLDANTCQKYKDVQASMNGMKDLASTAISENGELRRWNSSNLDIIYKLSAIHTEIETIVENNALLMDALGALHYNSTPTEMLPDEVGDEYQEELERKKLKIEADMEQYIKELENKVKGMTGAQNIAFAAFAGISLLVQITPAFLRGVRRLQLGTVQIGDLNVVVRSSTSGVGMAVNMKTGNKYFVDVSDDAVTKVLGKVSKDGGSMGGFFDLFASKSTKQKVGDFMNEEKLAHSRDRLSEKIKLSKSGLEKAAEWTKDMDDAQFDDFLKKITSSKDGADGFLSKATNKPGVEVKLPAKGGIMSKLTAKLKPVGQFFSKVKSAIKSVATSFKKTKLWQGLKKYGFDAIGAIMAAASIGMCIHQAHSTIKGAKEMNDKLNSTATEIVKTRKGLVDARENVKNLTDLQAGLFANLTGDTTQLLNFFVNDTSSKEDTESVKRLKEEVAKETPKFRDLLEKVEKVGSDQAAQKHLRNHLQEFLRLLEQTRFSLIRIYQKVKMGVQVSNSVNVNIPVATIMINLVLTGFQVDGTFDVVNEIAWSNKEMDFYDSYPLNCIRKGVITDQLSLDQFMKASGTKVVSEQVKTTIRMAVDFYDSPIEKGKKSIVQLLAKQGKVCGDGPCGAEDILGVIAELYPNETEYDGHQLEQYRKGKSC